MKINTTTVALILLIVFVVLRLTGNIAWSWWWVTSPALFLAGLWGLLFTGLILAELGEDEPSPLRFDEIDSTYGDSQ